MARREANEKSRRSASTKVPYPRTPAAAQLTDQDLARVAGGYIGETEKNVGENRAA